MKKLIGLSLGCFLLTAGSGLALAQDSSVTSAQGVEGPPHVLVIQREFLKPGRDGSMHEKTESAFVRAMTAAKSQTHYFAMVSMSGQPAALFFMPFDSYADWEKANMNIAHDASLSAAMDRAGIADGDLLTSEDQSVWELNKDESLNEEGSIAQMRYMEITSFKVRPGHHKEWTDLVKMYKDAYANETGAGWAMFESEYGPENDVYLMVKAIKSLSEVDQEDANSKQVRAALGEDGLKKADALVTACVESSRSELFQFNAKMSYAPEPWIKEDPGFWKLKTEPMAKKKADETKK